MVLWPCFGLQPEAWRLVPGEEPKRLEDGSPEQAELSYQLRERAGLVGSLVAVPSNLPGALVTLLITLLPAPANSVPSSPSEWRPSGPVEKGCLSRV